MSSDSFLRRHFLLLLGILLIIDWIFEYPLLEMYLSPSAFGNPASATNLTHRILGQLTHLGATQLQLFKGAWLITLLPMFGLLWRRYAPLFAFVVWIAMLFWWSSDYFALYGFHCIAGLFLFVAGASHWVRDEELLWIWGRRFLCFIYFNIGFAKLLNPEWRHGEVLWAIACFWSVKYHFLSTAWLSQVSWFFVLSSWFVIATQTLAPVLLIQPRFSPLFRWANVFIYIAIFLSVRFVLFPPLMILLNACFLYQRNIKPQCEGSPSKLVDLPREKVAPMFKPIEKASGGI